MESYLNIVDLLSNKEPKALETLYVQYGKRFYSYCVKRWRLTEDDAWEVVYKTLDTLVAKARAYNFASQKDFDAFVFKVLINFLRQHYRKVKSSKEDAPAVSIDDASASHRVQATAITQLDLDADDLEPKDSNTMASLKAALAQLNENDRDMLLLRAQDYSYEEIRQLLNIEDSQLKVRHFRAKQKLIDVLKSMQIIK